MAEGPWVKWPPPAGWDVQEWTWFIQAMRAARQKDWAIGHDIFPRQTFAEDLERAAGYTYPEASYTGVVDEIGDGSTLTDFSKAWAAGRWYDYTGPEIPPAARFYDVTVEADELNPWGCIRTKILGNTGSVLTLDQGPILDAVVAGRITAVSDLKHKRYYIQREDKTTHPSREWARRWPEWPNAMEYAHGFCTAGAKGVLFDTSANWKPDLFKTTPAKQLMCIVGGRLKRLAVTGNASDAILFDSQLVPQGGTEYAVIDLNKMWAPGRAAAEPFRWYRGVDRFSGELQVDPAVYSHHPDDTIQPTPVAVTQVFLRQANTDGTACVDNTPVDAFDVDLWTAIDDECTPPDLPYSPDFYKAWLRALQGWTVGICDEFVENRNWDFLKVAPWTMSAAELLRAANVNQYTRTVLSASPTHITFAPITLPRGAIPEETWGVAVHYSVLDGNGKPFVYGTTYAATTINGVFGGLMGTLASATRIDLRGPTTAESNAFLYPPPQGYLDNWVGRTVRISLEFTRKIERRVRHKHAATAFIPAFDGAVAKAPTSAEPGSYVTRAASAVYAEYDFLGRLTEAGGHPFRDGEFARYVGDNVFDPTTADGVQDGRDPDTPYRDRLLEVVRRPELQRQLDELLAGSATAGGRSSLTDDTKDWHDDGVGGVAGVETGTATAGSTTSLTDTGKAGNGMWDTATGRWAGFVVEVFIAGEWHERPITTFSQATQTIGWRDELPSAARSGTPYRIVQPLVLNRYKGRKVRLTGPDLDGKPVTIDVDITHSSGRTLFFAPQAFTVAKGWRYFILEDRPGGVWKWVASPGQWVKPTGLDTRSDVPWHPNQVENEPTVVTRFGRFLHGDEVSIHLFAELFRVLNCLVWIRRDGFWTINSGERNRQGETVVLSEPPPISIDRLKSELIAHFNDTLPSSVTTELPHAVVRFFGSDGGTGAAEAAFMYAILPNAPTVRMAHAADAYAYASTDVDDVGEYDAGGNPAGPDSGSMKFDPQGQNVRFRTYSRLASVGPTSNSSDAIKVGQIDTCPTGWPPVPTELGDPAWDHASAAWSVARPGGTGSEAPVILIRYDVAGGMTFLQPPIANAPGVGLSGVFPLTL